MKYTKSQLEGMKAKEIQKVASREFGIKGAYDMKKGECIDRILEHQRESQKAEREAEKKVKEAEKTESKEAYLEGAPLGTLVAFKVPDAAIVRPGEKKVKSAKIVGRNISKKKLRLQTEYDAFYIVPFENVLWVKTGSRWPRSIYNLLKGVTKLEG